MGIKKSISSGILSNSETIVEEECWLNGLILTGGSADAEVILYDSDDSDTVASLEVGFVNQQAPVFNYAVHCPNGIYARVENGAEYMVLFSRKM